MPHPTANMKNTFLSMPLVANIAHRHQHSAERAVFLNKTLVYGVCMPFLPCYHMHLPNMWLRRIQNTMWALRHWRCATMWRDIRHHVWLC